MPWYGAARILHVTEATGAGVLAYITMVANRQAAGGHPVTVLCLGARPDRPPHWRASFDPAVRVIECDPDEGRIGRFLAFVRAIQAAVKRHEPDALHLHSSIAGALGRCTIALSSSRLKPTIVYQPHGLSFLRRDVSWPARKLFLAIEWLLARLPGALLAVSSGEKAHLQCLRGEGVYLIRNGVEIDEVPLRNGSGETRLRVGTVNRICAQKDPDFFIEVARRLPSHRFSFVWVGDGDEALKARLRAAGITVRGWLPRPQALAELSRFDLYLQPSRWEGLPLSLIEAQVSGVPSVVRKVIGNREVIERTGGGRLASSAQEAATKLLALADSTAERDALGRRGRLRAMRKFSLDRVVLQLDAIYRETGRSYEYREPETTILGPMTVPQ